MRLVCFDATIMPRRRLRHAGSRLRHLRYGRVFVAALRACRAAPLLYAADDEWYVMRARAAYATMVELYDTRHAFFAIFAIFQRRFSPAPDFSMMLPLRMLDATTTADY